MNSFQELPKSLKHFVFILELQPLIITLALIGKSASAAAFSIVYMFTAELSPTVVRNAAMGLCSCAARIGAMIAPYIAKSVS